MNRLRLVTKYAEIWQNCSAATYLTMDSGLSPRGSHYAAAIKASKKEFEKNWSTIGVKILGKNKLGKNWGKKKLG